MNTAATERPVDLIGPLASIVVPPEASLIRGPAAMLRMAQAYQINSDEDYKLAADELRAVKDKLNELEAKRTSIVGPLNKAVAAINDLFRAPLTALKQAETMFKQSMLGYTAAQERIAANAKREAEAVAAAARLRLDEEARKAAAAAAAETLRLQNVAAAAAASGDTQAAAEATQQVETVKQNAAMEVAAIQQVGAMVVARPQTAEPVKVAGVSSAKSFDYELVDFNLLVKHVAEHPEFISLLLPDSVRMRAIVKSLGLNTNLPGVRVFEKKTLRSK